MRRICPSWLRTAFFILSGGALTLTLSLSGSLTGILGGLVLALPVHGLLGRYFLAQHASAPPRRALRTSAFILSLCCAAYFSLSFAGELAARFPALGIGICRLLGGAAGALSVYALQFYLCAFLLAAVPPTFAFFRSLSRMERVFLIGWTMLMTISVFALYARTTAFDIPLYLHGEEWVAAPWNVVYSVDTPSLWGEFAAPGYAEVRHPLFSLITFPVGLMALAGGKLLAFAPFAEVALLAGCCGGLLAVTAVLLGRLARSRWVLALYALSHPVLVYALCVERYQLSVFLLVLWAYALVRPSGRAARLGLMAAAAGATATSAILTPLLAEDDARGRWIWLRETLCWACGFVAVCVALGRGATLLSAFTDAEALLSEHARLPLTLLARVAQYSSFITACFVATPFAIVDAPWPRFSWLPVTGIDPIGAALFVLCIMGFLWQRHNRFVRVCGVWLAFSVLLLPIVGWGGGEFPFFSIYFSWAAIPLAYFGLRGLTARGPVWVRFAAPFAAVAVLVAANAPALLALIRFALAYYPR